VTLDNCPKAPWPCGPADPLAAALTNKQIAQRLYLSHRTVADHRYQIFPKLGICPRTALRDALSVRSPG
jgi:DNA-binding NarL/FixJ family response regulator